jgi:uncharacterized protein YlxW (UPF0749 family)
MAAMEGSKSYKSPTHKLLGFFQRSRDAWKEKCRTAKATVKRLKNWAAKLQQSREQWKTRARQYEQELKDLRRELEAQKT